jgi:DNA mismatch endonuclease (patch repair protein)
VITRSFDVMTAEQRSRCMSRIRGKDTRPEKELRSALWRAGLRYRKHAKLPGRPDLVFASARVAVFVDGCFWHRCPLHSTKPKANADFWQRKLRGNVDRDRRVDATLADLGWTVLRLWEHEVDENLTRAAYRVQRAVGKRLTPSS